MLKPGVVIPIVDTNAEFEMGESFYTIRHFDNVGALLSTEYYGFDNRKHVLKGRVLEGAPALVN